MYLPTRLPETETRADPFSLDALIAWLRTKNPEDEYCWGDARNCLLHWYGVHLGFAPLPDASVYLQACYGFERVHDGFDTEIEVAIAIDRPWTFSAALSRATAIRGGV